MGVCSNSSRLYASVTESSNGTRYGDRRRFWSLRHKYDTGKIVELKEVM